MIRHLLLSLFYFASLPALADDPRAPQFAVPCEVVSVHDADTCVVNIGLRLGPTAFKAEHVTVRAWGYDAKEITRTRQTVNITDVELAGGKLARDGFVELLKRGRLFAEDAKLAGLKTKPVYGRWDAVLWLLPDDGSPWIYLPLYAERSGWLREPRHVTESTGGTP